MNEQAWGHSAPIVDGGPGWLTLSFVLIALGAVAALAILWWGTRLAIGRHRTQHELEARGEIRRTSSAHAPVTDVPAPRAVHDAPTGAETAAASGPAPSPVTYARGGDADPAPSDPIADEPIAAAAPLDAGPAALAASTPPAPAAPPAPAPAPTVPLSTADGTDDLTRLKGVGPRLAQRLNTLGFTRFEQLAALDAAGAEALDAQLDNFRGRLHRDRWIEQARLLAAGDLAGYEAAFGKL